MAEQQRFPMRTAIMLAEYSVKLRAEDYADDAVGYALLIGVKSLADATARAENALRAVETDPSATFDQRRYQREPFLAMLRELDQAASRLAQHRRGQSLDELARAAGLTAAPAALV